MDAEPEFIRAHPRTSMFVLASMAAASVSGPIKIRNMSPAGALIEGELLPKVGEQLRLRRADLSVSGTVVWREARKAGLSFDGEVRVTDWLPAGSSRQSEVDNTFHELKRRPADVPVPAARIEPSATNGADLLDIAAAIDALADELAEDRAVVARYASRLQILDIASQALRKLGAPASNGFAAVQRR